MEETRWHLPNSLMLAFVITSNALMYTTLPLHARLLWVLSVRRRDKSLHGDGAFRTLMIHTTIVNLVFAVVFCFLQSPAAVGVLYHVFKAIGEYASRVEMIKSTGIVFLGILLHLVLALSRYTAIARASQHARIWSRLSRWCALLWLLTLLISLPLLFPGTNAPRETTNVLGLPAIEFTFLGYFYVIYSVICNLLAALLEVITIACYAGLYVRFRAYLRAGVAHSQLKEAGVVRTTVAAMCTSAGSWLILGFFSFIYAVQFTNNSIIGDQEFSAVFGLLNSINNVLTPWVLIMAFPKFRQSLFAPEFEERAVYPIEEREIPRAEH